MADTTGTELTYGKTLIGSLLFCRWLRNHCAGQSMVGVILPASVGGALANIAILLAGKVPVNLNFTAGKEAMAAALEQCQHHHHRHLANVFWTRPIWKKSTAWFFVEEIRQDFSAPQKLPPRSKPLLLPAPWLNRRHAQTTKPERSRHDHFFQRQHRRAQRRDAVAPQYRCQRRGDRPSDSVHAAGSHHGRPAAVSLLRLHRRRSGCRCWPDSASSITPIPPTPRPSARP